MIGLKTVILSVMALAIGVMVCEGACSGKQGSIEISYIISVVMHKTRHMDAHVSRVYPELIRKV